MNSTCKHLSTQYIIMPKDKGNIDDYPKQSGNDKRWKQQDEFDSAGMQRLREDEDHNASIPESDSETAEKRKSTDE